MYSLTTNEPPYVHVGGDGGRKFIIEEMYLSFASNKAVCRFCTKDTVNEVFGPACCERQTAKDARSLNNKGSRGMFGPICFNKINISKTLLDNEKVYFFHCTSCKWNSINIGMTEKNMVNIYAIQGPIYQKKDLDKSAVFKALLDQLTFNQEEIIKREKREIRQKKKTNLVEEHKGSGVKERK